MLRLGELLLEARQLPASHLEEALRAQVMWGGRLGTSLVDLGLLELEQLTTLLARQRRMPAALARHFASADPELQKRLPAQVAEKYQCIPLCKIPDDKLVVATVGPWTSEQQAAIAEVMGVAPAGLIVSIAPELRIRYQLEQVYGIQRTARFLRSGTDNTPFPTLSLGSFEDGLDDADTTFHHGDELEDGSITVAFQPRAESQPGEPDAASLEPVPTLDSLGVASDEAQKAESEEAARAKRSYLPTIAAPDARRPFARIATRRGSAVREILERRHDPGSVATIADAQRAIKRARDRDRVADLTIEAVQTFVVSSIAGCLLVVRGDVATSWKGFVRGAHELTELSIPINQATLVSRAVGRRQTCRAVVDALCPLDRELCLALHPNAAELVILPLAIAQQVLAILALALRSDALSLTEAEAIAVAATTTFARLMRDATR